MITGIFFNIIYGLVVLITYPIRILPDVSLSPEISNAISNINGFLAGLNVILPISTLLAVLGAVLGIELAIFGYKVVMWIIKRLPTQS